MLTRSVGIEFSVKILSGSQLLIRYNKNVTFLPVRGRTCFTWKFHLLLLRKERQLPAPAGMH